MVAVAGLLAAGISGAATGGLPGVALADSGTPSLMPAAGQFFPVPAVKVLDTRFGTGGVPAAPVSAGATVTFPVTGVGDIPDEVSDVYVVITSLGPQGSGCLHDYDADLDNPGICTVPFAAGQEVSVSDIVQVGASGFVAVTNSSPGATDVAVTVIGYDQTTDTQTAGQTYVGLPEHTVLDTRSGIGAPDAQIPAGGSVTIQVTGNSGIPADAAGAALYLGTANASATGYVSAFPAGGTDPGLAIMSYSPARTVHNLYYGALSDSGQLTLVNHGTAPVDLLASAQGYLVSPAASEAGGTYQDVPEERIVDTRFGTGGVPATPVPAGGSITFTATGVDSVPAGGAPVVAQTVAALNPTGNGYLSVYPAGSNDPQQPGVNFNASDGQDNDLTTPLVSAVSPTGEETITNHSSGTVDIVVAARGYYAPPAAPDDPMQVDASMQGGTGTITWAPPDTDGGAAITSYTATVYNSDGSVNQTISTGPAATSATATGLSDSSTYTATVSAANAVGTSSGATTPVSEIQAGSAVTQTQTITEPMQFDVDPSTGDMTLDTSSGTATTYNLNGDMTGSDDLMPSDPFATPDSKLGSFACVINTQRNVGITAHKPFYGDLQNSAASMQWFNEAYTVANARWVAGEGETMQDMVCTTGGGEPKGSWHMTFVGEAVYLKTTVPRKLGQSRGGTNKSYNKNSGNQSITVGYSLPVGKAGSINGNVTFDLNKGTESYDVGNDGKFPGFSDGQYWKNRENVFWITADNHVWDGTTSYKGNTMETLFEWPMSQTTHHKLGIYPALEYICGSIFGC